MIITPKQIEQAKTAIVMLCNTRPDEEFDYGQLADALGTELPIVVRACRELEDAGVIIDSTERE